MTSVGWKELHGASNWAGLLNPLHPELREKLITDVELGLSIFYGLDHYNPDFSFYANYGKSTLISSVDPGQPLPYNITRYIYTTSEGADELAPAGQFASGPNRSVWMGFVAVSNDEETQRLGRREIAVAFRGTLTTQEMDNNFNFGLVAFPDLQGSVEGQPKVHNGFQLLYRKSSTDATVIFPGSLRDQVIGEVRRLIGVHAHEEMCISTSGFSLGGALAILCAFDIANNKVNVVNEELTIPISAFPTAAPRVGGQVFKGKVESLVKILRVVDKRDLFPTLPPKNFGYEDVGVVIKFDASVSPYLRPIADNDTTSAHNPEKYMHALAGAVELEPPTSKVPAFDKKTLKANKELEETYISAKKQLLNDSDAVDEFMANFTSKPVGTFDFVVDRDIALLNKMRNTLKDELGIPANWWIPPNMGKVKLSLKDGKRVWLPREKRTEDILAADNQEYN